MKAYFTALEGAPGADYSAAIDSRARCSSKGSEKPLTWRGFFFSATRGTPLSGAPRADLREPEAVALRLGLSEVPRPAQLCERLQDSIASRNVAARRALWR